MQELCTNAVLPDAPWVSQPTAESITVCKIGQRKSSTDGETIPVVTRSLTVRFNCSWVVVVHGKQVAIKHCHAHKGFPIQYADTLQKLIQAL